MKNHYPQWQFHNSQIAEPGFRYECDLEQSWFSLSPGTSLISMDGTKIGLIYPGNKNRNEGPDAKGARILVNGRIMEGDVEFHLKAENWFHHGHHQNTNFDHVILHVLGEETEYAILLPGMAVILKGQPSIQAECTLEEAVTNHEDVLTQFAKIRWNSLVISFSLKRYSGDHWKRMLMRKSFSILGKGGNEDTFSSFADNIHYSADEGFDEQQFAKLPWKALGMRPSQRPINRMELAKTLAAFISGWQENYHCRPEIFKQEAEIWTEKYGKGICTELLINVFYPAMASEAAASGRLDAIRLWEREWTALKLPYTYAKFKNRFSHVLSQKQLRSVAVLQGLKQLDTDFCKLRHCSVCPLKKHGSLD